jgi:hypothetical protein
MRVYISATGPIRLGVPTSDLLALRAAAPLVSWAALVRKAQDEVYRLACEGHPEAAIVGPITAGRYTRRKLRDWAKHFDFKLQFIDSQTD